MNRRHKVDQALWSRASSRVNKRLPSDEQVGGLSAYQMMESLPGAGLSLSGGRSIIEGEGLKLSGQGGGALVPALKLKEMIMEGNGVKSTPAKKRNPLTPGLVSKLIVDKFIPVFLRSARRAGIESYKYTADKRKIFKTKFMKVLRKQAQAGGIFGAILPILTTLAGPLIKGVTSLFKGRGKKIIVSDKKLPVIIKADITKLIKMGRKFPMSMIKAPISRKMPKIFERAKNMMTLQKFIPAIVKGVAKLSPYARTQKGGFLGNIAKFIFSGIKKLFTGQGQKGGIFGSIIPIATTIIKGLAGLFGKGQAGGFLKSLFRSIGQVTKRTLLRKGARRLPKRGGAKKSDIINMAVMKMAKDLKDFIKDPTRQAGAGFFSFIKKLIKKVKPIVKKAIPIVKKAIPIVKRIAPKVLNVFRRPR